MKNFFVIGDQASKSLSPLIFNYWFKKYNLKAKYSYIQTDKASFDKKIKQVLSDNKTRGLNITIPFKRQAIKHAGILDIHSKTIQAVNCITKKNNIEGSNTDWVGYFKSLPKNSTLSKKTVVLIGYGGAAHAIHYLLLKKKVKKIIIINKTKRKLKFTKKNRFTTPVNKLQKYINIADIIINATPINPIKEKHVSLVKKTAIVSDIVYKPKETLFLKQFPKNKKTYGINMLIYQAIPCFKKWFGFYPSVDKKLLQLINKKIL